MKWKEVEGPRCLLRRRIFGRPNDTFKVGSMPGKIFIAWHESWPVWFWAPFEQGWCLPNRWAKVWAGKRTFVYLRLVCWENNSQLETGKTTLSPILLQLRRWLRSCIIANSARLILKNKNLSRLTRGCLFVPNIITWKVALVQGELMSFNLLFPLFLVLRGPEPKLAFKASLNFSKNLPVRSEMPPFDLAQAKGYETLNKNEAVNYLRRKGKENECWEKHRL